jgi:hypothetical protein
VPSLVSIVLQPRRFIAEDPLVHQFWFAADDQSESDVRQDILLQIDTGAFSMSSRPAGVSRNT